MIRKEREGRLRDKFPILYAEFPREFRMFFDENGKMTSFGRSLNILIKNRRRQRMKKP